MFIILDENKNVVARVREHYLLDSYRNKGYTVLEDNRQYRQLYPYIKAHAFDVLDYYSANRHQFDGLHFAAQFQKLFNECKPIMDLDDDALSSAVDLVLTLEQRRMNSYSQGNTHIEDYVPANVKDWREYMK